MWLLCRPLVEVGDVVDAVDVEIGTQACEHPLVHGHRRLAARASGSACSLRVMAYDGEVTPGRVRAWGAS